MTEIFSSLISVFQPFGLSGLIIAILIGAVGYLYRQQTFIYIEQKKQERECIAQNKVFAEKIAILSVELAKVKGRIEGRNDTEKRLKKLLKIK